LLSVERELRQREQDAQLQLQALKHRLREVRSIPLTMVVCMQQELWCVQMEGSTPDLQRQMDIVKDSLRDVGISEPLYLEYKNIPETQQGLRV
jgi:hypothetical protein